MMEGSGGDICMQKDPGRMIPSSELCCEIEHAKNGLNKEVPEQTSERLPLYSHSETYPYVG